MHFGIGVIRILVVRYVPCGRLTGLEGIGRIAETITVVVPEEGFNAAVPGLYGLIKRPE